MTVFVPISNQLKKLKLSLLFLLTAPLFSIYGQTQTAAAPAPPDTARIEIYQPIEHKGVLNEPEIRAYQSDIWLINFANRGRIGSSAWRGMPAGFSNFNYAGNRLQNPVTGFWNEQWLPHYQIGERRRKFGSDVEYLQQVEPLSRKPETRIIYSQDYLTGISFVDINFARYWSPTNFVQLSGNNFLGEESDIGKKYQVNTYRARVHWEYTRWKWDAYYWQMRQLSNVFSLVTPIENDRITAKLKSIGHVMWLRGQWRMSERDSLEIVPSYIAVEDRLTPISAAFDRRNIRYKIGQLNATFTRDYGGGSFGFAALPQIYRNEHFVHPAKRTESTFRGNAFWESADSSKEIRLEAGGFYDTASGALPEVQAVFAKKWAGGRQIGLRVFSGGQPVPLIWRTVGADSLPKYSGENPIRKTGVSGIAEFSLGDNLDVRIEPFLMRTENYPVFLDGNRWQTQTIENYGFRTNAATKIWRFWITNDFTWNANYKESFAPQIKNVTTLKTSVSLFNNALRLDGILDWRVLGEYYPLDFQPQLYAFSPLPAAVGPHAISDARIQAQFRDATLFFIWENVLSTDYFVINGTLEQLIIFRLGIDWLLFN